MIINNNQDNNDNNNQYNNHSDGKRREHVSSPSFHSLLRALGWNAERGRWAEQLLHREHREIKLCFYHYFLQMEYIFFHICNYCSNEPNLSIVLLTTFKQSHASYNVVHLEARAKVLHPRSVF